MPPRCLLYYITDRTAFHGDESERRERLLEKISEAARAGVDYIQLREKDLPSREMETLARAAVGAIREAHKLAPDPLAPALLINSRTDIALGVGANGVHLRSDDISPADVRNIWKQSGPGAGGVGIPGREPLIAVSCHTPDQVSIAERESANFAVFAPVFGKKDAPMKSKADLDQLRDACQRKIPVLALGGVSVENARSCLEVGAAGIAGIRLFQENEIAEVVQKLQNL